MVESGSSLFYLFHCSAHDRLNTMPFRLFRNTPHGLHPVRLDFDRRTKELCLSTPRTDCIFRAMWSILMRSLCLSTPRTDCILGDAQSLVRDVLCLSTPRTDCIVSHAPPRPVPSALPQHTPHGLHLYRCRHSSFNLAFASAHPARIASILHDIFRHTNELCLSTPRTDCIEYAPCAIYFFDLCLSTPRTDCISKIAQMQCHKSTQYAVSW